MSTYQRTPIQDLKNDQSSYASQSPYRPAQFTYQIPKIDHAFIVQSYRNLRIQQRDQLARLRMPDDMKIKIFNFRQDENLKYEKPQLVIFNHPFRGKMVLTRPEVQKQLERQRKNSELASQFQSKGQKVPQNIFNEMGLDQEQVQLKKTKMIREPTGKEQNYPRKPRLASNQPERKVAQEINKEQQKLMENQMYFVHKNKEHQETEKEKDQKMQKFMDEKQSKMKATKNQADKRQPDEKEKNRKTSKISFKDMPIIGEQPKVVRDIKFDSSKTITSQQDMNRPLFKEQRQKLYYRPFGNQHQIRQFGSNKKKKNNEAEEEQRFGSGQRFMKRKGLTSNNPFANQNARSLSEISAIPSNDKDNDLSDNQSLNKGLFNE